jgi:hypothetical protein
MTLEDASLAQLSLLLLDGEGVLLPHAWLIYNLLGNCCQERLHMWVMISGVNYWNCTNMTHIINFKQITYIVVPVNDICALLKKCLRNVYQLHSSIPNSTLMFCHKLLLPSLWEVSKFVE